MENGRGSEEHVTAICYTVFDAIVIITIYIYNMDLSNPRFE